MSKIRKSAQGQPCEVRLPGICQFNNETTVLAHHNGAGVGKKDYDFIGAYCCYDCHSVIDNPPASCHLTRAELDLYFYEGIFRTQRLLFNAGLIQTKGSK